MSFMSAKKPIQPPSGEIAEEFFQRTLGHLLPLKNCIQEYAWGSRTALPGLLRQESPSPTPQAELWMGAHPQAPSEVRLEGAWFSLSELLEQCPLALLGREVLDRFGPHLPFLFKVLAADRPLSLQAHPTERQATNGFSREDAEGIPLESEFRNYKDKHHKPEVLCALTPFWALSGFRKPERVLERMRSLSVPGLDPLLAPFLQTPGGQGLKSFFSSLMALSREEQHVLVLDVITALRKGRSDPETRRWVQRLNEEYPSDVGALGPLFLRLVRLSPGEAMFIPAGILHAYLEGMGVELMANSDNVLRGGCTSKHIDVQELLSILRFQEASSFPCRIHRDAGIETTYETPAKEFVLSVLRLSKRDLYEAQPVRGPQILLCAEGQVELAETRTREGRSLSLRKGDSVLVPASLPSYKATGNGTLYKAGVPIAG